MEVTAEEMVLLALTREEAKTLSTIMINLDWDNGSSFAHLAGDIYNELDAVGINHFDSDATLNNHYEVVITEYTD